MSSRSARKAFTLIELLVVISIISLLIAILLPALSKAQDAAKTTNCMSTLRMIGTANHMFADERRGYFSPHFGVTAPAGFWSSLGCVATPAGVSNFNHLEEMRSYMSVSTNDDTRRRNEDGFICPSLPKPPTGSSVNHYAYNPYVASDTPGGPKNVANKWGLKRDNCVKPSQYVLMGELYRNAGDLIVINPPQYGFNGPTEPWGTATTAYIAPHNVGNATGDGNYLFTDNHVQTLKGDQGHSDLRPDGRGGVGGAQWLQMWAWWTPTP
jgi:prepilin-type N-terminal cleavage/methylation domain-containing protein